MKLIFQILVITIGGVFAFTYALPEWHDVQDLRAQVVDYDNALDNAKILQQKRDEILASYNSISQNNKERLTKLLPDIDPDIATSGSVALVLEIDKIATENGLRISDIQFNSDINGKENSEDSANNNSSSDHITSSVSFKVQSSYSGFLNFVQDLEMNLRIVDIKKISFASPKPTRENPIVNSNILEYSFELQSYWLNNSHE